MTQPMMRAVERQRLPLLWGGAGAVVAAFLLTLEFVARHYGHRGPVTSLGRELVFAPQSGAVLYGGLALMMVVLTRRQRLLAAGFAIGIDVVFLVVRLAVDARPNFGNGALWVLITCAVIAVTRRTGRERILMLKGVGLGSLLIAGHKTGATWLLITSETRPMVLDPYVAVADHALGDPSWLAGRVVEASGPLGEGLLGAVYGQLPLAAALVALYQLRHVATEGRFPGHHLVRTFLVIGLLGPAFYMIFPVVGPVYAYGADGGAWASAHLWPDVLPTISTPQPFLFDGITPRNCMPSLHTAWATTLFLHSRNGSRLMRFAGTFWLICTLAATLGFGYHYGADLVAGVVFALTIEVAMRAFDRGWDRQAGWLVAYGVTVFAAMLVSYRYIPMEMARYPWIFGPLLILSMLSVIHAYVRLTRQWNPKTPPPNPDPPIARVRKIVAQRLPDRTQQGVL
ncbi:phosphatase PAP2 family protein [Streptomyces boninensis]|uniref:phosphatase PAP2 family protein n=1 Tax=Streptomyces boninensis TaxID=2039455 RepID=UPI003B214FFA